jgi:hypothetical protein
MTLTGRTGPAEGEKVSGKGVSLDGAGCSWALLEYVSQNESSPFRLTPFSLHRFPF